MVQAGKGGQGQEGEEGTAIISEPRMAPGGIRVQSRRPSPGYTGALGTAHHKADATGTTWVVGEQRSWQPKGLQGHVGEILQRQSIKKQPQIKT